MTHSPQTCPHCGLRARTSANGIIAAVTAGRHPLTTLEIAAKLRAPADMISSRLSKLANRGLIKREYRSVSNTGDGGHRYAVWSAKAVEATS